MKNKLITKILSESKKSKKIIGIRKYGDEDAFWCGYIVDFNDALVTIQHFTKYGKPDGLIIERIEDIESIDVDDPYSVAFQYLIKNSHKIEKQTAAVPGLPQGDNWRADILSQLHKKNILVSIDTEDVNVCGFVLSFDAEYFALQCVGKLGEQEGTSYYRIEDLDSIHLDGMELRKRKLLYDWKNK
jgi:hypothetical protein